jgi:hypothetical protein
VTRRAFTSTFAGKRRTLTIGPVDLIPLSEARERRDAARKHLLDGIDPAEVKARTKGQETDIPENAFRHMAKAWHDLRKKSLAPKYAYDQWTRLERLIFPHIGDTAITDLKPKDALKIFNRLEAKGTVETAHRSIQLIGQVLRLAVIRGQVDSDITRDLRGQLPPIPRDISRASGWPSSPASCGRSMAMMKAGPSFAWLSNQSRSRFYASANSALQIGAR